VNPFDSGDPHRKSVNILGADIIRIEREKLVACILEMISFGRSPNLFLTANVDHLYKIKKDREFSDIYRKTRWVIADGMPLVWVSRLLGEPIPCRINGTDLMEHLCLVAENAGLSIFLFGGSGDLAGQCRDALLKKHPRLQIRGAVSPSDRFVFPSAESDAMVETIRAARPDILFVGMGSPKQEKWLHRHLDRLAVPVCIGVGASFSFISGRMKRAPGVFQAWGLEWLWRLALEPRRLFKRYLFSNSYFSVAVIKILFRRFQQKIGGNH
jgi:N-acetylglucosaminyldiphosphoundecaprenol N-acetyl-beta-D-mannosaminyltransferase